MTGEDILSEAHLCIKKKQLLTMPQIAYIEL